MKQTVIHRIILAVLIVLPIYSKAELDPAATIRSLSGIVFDDYDSTGMEYVTVAIYKTADSSLVAGGFSDVDGSFQLDDFLLDEPGFIRFRYMGYKEKVIPLTEMRQNDLGNIYLQREFHDVDEVVVSAERGDVVHKVDKKVYNAEKIIAAGSTALDLLKSIPSIEVDGADKVSYRGQPDVTILIDGRPTSMAAEEVLKMMDASTVDQIELISNPSAKYDAEGMSGIINVITKKEQKRGFNGSFNTTFGYGENFRLTGNLALNFTSDKWRISTRYYSGYRKRSHDSYTDRSVYSADTLADRLISSGGDLNERYSNAFTGNIDHFINDNNTIYISGMYGHYAIEKVSFLDYENTDAQESVLYSSERDGTEWGPMKRYRLNAGWQSTFGKKSNTLDFDVNYSGSLHITEEAIEENLSLGERFTTDTYGEEDNSLLVAKLDFNFVINDSSKIETGLKNTFRSQNSLLELTNASTGTSLLDTTWTNNFNYEQNVIAGYVSYEKQWKKFALKLGLRGEQTNTSSDLKSDTIRIDQSYFELFPTAFVSYSFTDRSYLTLNYGRRINRPAMEQINPFIYYADRFMVDQGNAYIQPEFIHVTELSYSYYSTKINLEASIYYRHVKNKIRRYMRQEGLVSILSYKNVENSNLSGIDFSITYKPHKVFKVIWSTNVWNYQIRDKVITNNALVNSIGISTNLDFYVQLKQGWSIQFRNNYRPKYWVQQGYILPRYSMSLGVSNYFFRKHLKVSIMGTDLLNTQRYHYRASDQDYDLLANWNWESRILYVTVNWYFGKKFKGKQKRRGVNTDASDDNSVPGL
ncbi:MAG: TonB-dependent receptor [Crocinitomicaceae bacterium]|nr:TonB-dependent receptor [Crocinitomicaceae bacterium]